jgi:PAS domain S-box-containing protein
MSVAGSILPPLLHATPVAIACIDLQGRILDANRALLESSGFTIGELQGRSFPSFLEAADDGSERSSLARVVMENCDAYAGPRRYRTRAGEIREVDVRVAIVRDREGAPQYCLAVLQDVTEHRVALNHVAEAQRERDQLLRDAQRAHLQAEAANRLKDGFLSTLAHELRTPINAVILWAHILRSRHADAETQHALDAIEGSAVAQARLVNDLLDASRVITGRIQLRLELIDLSTVVRSAVESIGPAAAAKTIAVTSDVSAGLPAVRGDAQRLEQVFWNLLTNAVKFTDPGGAVSVRVRRAGERLVGEVSDTGHGIPSDILPFVFDHFTEADSVASRPHLGFGFGLAVVRRLVELHGGTVAAESAGPGHGSTFRVELPLTT